MEYFMSHLLYIAVASVAIAALCFIAVIVASKNAEDRTDDELSKRKEACSSCAMASMCMNMGQKEKTEDTLQ
ncbi:MAG: hypothetical protein HXL82_00455 [[Eubacterium] sulci]|nr:hypothetical protein [[Eubacterium] sulci]